MVTVDSKLDRDLFASRRVRDVDMHQTRLKNCGDAISPLDYVTLRQLRDEINLILGDVSLGGGSGTVTNITNNNTYNNTGPWYDNGTHTGVLTFSQSNGYKHKVTLSGTLFMGFSGFSDGDTVTVWIIDPTGGTLIGWLFGAVQDHGLVIPDAAGAELYIGFIQNGSLMVEQYASSFVP